ncbi:hypothetical protein G6653_04825 [Polynucleobacter paneuropaeus]|nr:hypothetical protein [Polynucleobacter paneuropaeus]
MNYLETSFLIIAIICVFWVLSAGILNIGKGFSTWDAIASWNRWGTEWAHGVIPQGTLTYPQGLPILYSLSYVLLGNYDINIFSFLIVIYFPILIIISLLIIYEDNLINLNQLIIFTSILILFTVGTGSIDVFYSGYSDIPILFFGLLCLIFVLEINKNHLILEKNIYLYTLIISIGAICKQVGLIYAIFFPILIYLLLLKDHKSKNKIYSKLFLVYIIVGVVGAHWYLYQYYQSSGIQVVPYTAILVDSVIFRIIHALKLLTTETGLIWIPVFFYGLFSYKNILIFTILILPILIIYSLLASGDIRAMFITFPAIAYIISCGIIKLQYKYSNNYYQYFFKFWLTLLTMHYFLKFNYPLIEFENFIIHKYIFNTLLISLLLVYCFKNKFSFRIKSIYLITIALMVLIIIQNIISNDKLARYSKNMQLQIGEPQLNKLISEYTINDNLLIASSFQILYGITGIKERYKLYYCDDFTYLDDKKFGYSLYPPSCPSHVLESINNNYNNSLKLIFKINGYYFYKIIN